MMIKKDKTQLEINRIGNKKCWMKNGFQHWWFFNRVDLLIWGDHLFFKLHFFLGQLALINRGGIINPHLALYGNIYHQYTPNVSIYIYHTWILWVMVYKATYNWGAHPALDSHEISWVWYMSRFADFEHHFQVSVGGYISYIPNIPKRWVMFHLPTPVNLSPSVG